MMYMYKCTIAHITYVISQPIHIELKLPSNPSYLYY
jgi:hypothetical protein